MDEDSKKCCGCVDFNCGPQKNIKQELKVVDTIIERQRAAWSMLKIIKKSVKETRSHKKRVEK